MTIFADNLVKLRKAKGLTQTNLADETGLNRAVIGAYEEKRAEPSLATLQRFSDFFKISLDELVKKEWRAEKRKKKKSPVQLRILTVPVDSKTGNEKVSVVPLKAAAGYLNGFGDVEYIESLPVFDLPLKEISAQLTYRIFQIAGDSMLPLESGSYVITQFESDWLNLKKGQCYVFVTESEGIVYKRLIDKPGPRRGFVLGSDNPVYEPYQVTMDEVKEVWRASGFISFQIPGLG
jgi:transcriptional regulator with XRE-family HTH domain